MNKCIEHKCPTDIDDCCVCITCDTDHNEYGIECKTCKRTWEYMP